MGFILKIKKGRYKVEYVRIILDILVIFNFLLEIKLF